MSKYNRKTEDEYRIEGNYGYGWEEVTCETNWKDARANLKAYRENEPGTPFRVHMVRVPKVEQVTA